MPAAACRFCGSTEGPDHICPGQNVNLIGQVLDGRYQIEEAVGQGGMGLVFRAVQTSVQRTVAIKTLHPGLAAAPQFFERFRREAEMASRLRHPNIITIFDFNRAPDGTCYFVMEFVDGESLKQIVRRDGPMTLGRAVDLIEQVARALGHAHENGVVHRDVKPHNIMVQSLDQKEFVKVLDFGLVKAIEQDDEQQLTSTGQVLGTPQYMPPEQAGGEVVDARSDLYSLAGVFYYCLTGSSPFGANSVRKALQASLTQTVPPVGRKRGNAPVPPALDEFFRKALAREKEDRHQTAEAFIAEMREAVADVSRADLDAVPTILKDTGSSSQKEPSGAASSSRVRGSSSRQPGSRSGKSGTPSNVVVDPELKAEVQRPSSRSVSRSARAEDPAVAALRRGRTTRTLAVVAIGSVAVLTGGAVLLFGGGSDPVPAPVQRVEVDAPAPLTPKVPTRPASAPTTPPVVTPAAATRPTPQITVRFESDPPGAGIYEGRVQIGATPVSLKFDRTGQRTLTFRLAGHLPAERTVDFSHQSVDETTIKVPLSPIPARTTARATGNGNKRPPPPPPPDDGDDEIPVFE